MSRTNLITNPTFEINEGGWDNPASRCILSASTDRAWSGSKSLKVVHNQSGVGANQSGTGWPNHVLTNGVVYTFSAYVYIPTGSPHINLNVQGGGYSATGTTTTVYDAWQRLTVTLTGNGNGAYFYLLNTTTTTAGQAFYVDAALLEARVYAGEYFDGSVVNIHTNAWTGTAHASSSTQVVTSGIVNIVNGANNVTAADPTITSPETPIAGDVMVLVAINGDSVNPTAVSGLGATWTKATFTKAISYGSVWIGVGATTTGTITATQSASGNGRALQLFHLRGVAPTFIGFGGNDEKISKLGNANQVVIAVGNGSNTTNGLLDASYYPAVGNWTKPANIEMTTGARNVQSAYLVPSASGAHYSESDRELFMFSIGTPGSVVVRQNLIAKPGFEDGTTNNYGWANVTGQFISAGVSHSGTRSISAFASGANAEFSMYSGNTGAQVTMGQVYTWSVWVRCDHARTAYVGVSYTGATPATWGTPTSIPANTWTRVSKTEYAGASGAVGRMTVRFTDTASGEQIFADDFMCEQTGTLNDYFDGQVFDADRQNYWDGTALLSTSTQVAFGTPPAERINLVTNPSFEVDTTGWSAVNGAVARSTSESWVGTASGRMTFTASTAALAGTMTTTVTGLTIGQTYTASLMARRISTDTPLQIVVNDGTNKYGTTTLNGGSQGWELLKVTFVAAATSATVGITNTALTGASNTGYVDIVTVQLGTDPEPFCGGSTPLPGQTYTWLGAPNASASIAKAGRVNQARNPSFGDGTRYGWNGTNISGTVTVDTTEGGFGNTNCLKFVLSAGGATHLIKGTSGSGNTAEMCPVIPGRTYTITAYVKTATLSSVRMDVNGANASGVLTATSYSSPSYVNTLGSAVWTRFRNTVQVAAGDYFLVPSLQGSWTSGSTVWLDGFMIEESGAPGTFFDGEPRNDWTTNAWTGTRYLSPATQSYTPVTSPTVVGVHTGAVFTAANPTVSLPVTPAPDDVLILLASWSSSLANPQVSAVTGAGATWKEMAGASDYVTAWIGTGATASGTITATATATTNGRALRLYHLRGVSPDAFLATPSASYPKLATPNQIAIGVGYNTSAGTPTYKERPHPSRWHDEAEIAFVADPRHWSSAWIAPPGGELYYTGASYSGLIVAGAPYAGTRLVRRNPVQNASLEIIGGTQDNYLPNAIVTTPVHHGKGAYGGVSTNTPAKVMVGETYEAVAIRPNSTYTFSAWVWCSAATTAALVPTWRASSKGNIGSAPSPSYVAVPASTWTQVTWTGTTYYNPTNYGAYWVTPEVWFTNVTGDACYVDQFAADEGSSVRPFLDATYTPAADEFVWSTGDKYSNIGITQDGYFPQGYATELYELIPPPGSAVVKVREAGAWVVRTPVGKARVGGAWVESELRFWTGTEWITV